MRRRRDRKASSDPDGIRASESDPEQASDQENATGGQLPPTPAGPPTASYWTPGRPVAGHSASAPGGSAAQDDQASQLGPEDQHTRAFSPESPAWRRPDSGRGDTAGGYFGQGGEPPYGRSAGAGKAREQWSAGQPGYGQQSYGEPSYGQPSYGQGDHGQQGATAQQPDSTERPYGAGSAYEQRRYQGASSDPGQQGAG